MDTHAQIMYSLLCWILWHPLKYGTMNHTLQPGTSSKGYSEFGRADFSACGRRCDFVPSSVVALLWQLLFYTTSWGNTMKKKHSQLKTILMCQCLSRKCSKKKSAKICLWRTKGSTWYKLSFPNEKYRYLFISNICLTFSFLRFMFLFQSVRPKFILLNVTKYYSIFRLCLT